MPPIRTAETKGKQTNGASPLTTTPGRTSQAEARHAGPYIRRIKAENDDEATVDEKPALPTRDEIAKVESSASNVAPAKAERVIPDQKGRARVNFCGWEQALKEFGSKTKTLAFDILTE